MRQFDVLANPSSRYGAASYVVVLQSHHVAGTSATVVAPMIVYDDRSAFTEISAVVLFGDHRYIVLVGELAALESRRLGASLGSLRDWEDDLRRALERLFTGF